MQAILNINLNEMNDNLFNIIKDLLSKDVEVVLRKKSIELEAYDQSMPLDTVIAELSEAGHEKEFLKDLKEGFKTSTVYINKC